MHDEPFRLVPPVPKRRPWRTEDRPAEMQGKLFAGSDCLAGQGELFCPDGVREQQVTDNPENVPPSSLTR